MNNPSWKDAPEWANWVAQDRNGDWFWYEHEPMTFKCSWGAHDRVELASKPIEDWETTKQPRPTH